MYFTYILVYLFFTRESCQFYQYFKFLWLINHFKSYNSKSLGRKLRLWAIPTEFIEALDIFNFIYSCFEWSHYCDTVPFRKFCSKHLQRLKWQYVIFQKWSFMCIHGDNPVYSWLISDIISFTWFIVWLYVLFFSQFNEISELKQCWVYSELVNLNG